jgi:preprotein translocase subunit SecG
MYYILIAVYIVVCIFLIAVILLQAGRGAGLSDFFGGAAESVLGTQAPVVLKKLTGVCAVLFISIALILAVMGAYRGKSLFQGRSVPVMPQGIPTGVDRTSEVPVPAQDANAPAAGAEKASGADSLAETVTGSVPQAEQETAAKAVDAAAATTGSAIPSAVYST